MSNYQKLRDLLGEALSTLRAIEVSYNDGELRDQAGNAYIDLSDRLALLTAPAAQVLTPLQQSIEASRVAYEASLPYAPSIRIKSDAHPWGWCYADENDQKRFREFCKKPGQGERQPQMWLIRNGDGNVVNVATRAEVAAYEEKGYTATAIENSGTAICKSYVKNKNMENSYNVVTPNLDIRALATKHADRIPGCNFRVAQQAIMDAINEALLASAPIAAQEPTDFASLIRQNMGLTPTQGDEYAEAVALCQAVTESQPAQGEPQPLNEFELCPHPECGRFKDGAGWSCRAMRDNACARNGA